MSFPQSELDNLLIGAEVGGATSTAELFEFNFRFALCPCYVAISDNNKEGNKW